MIPIIMGKIRDLEMDRWHLIYLAKQGGSKRYIQQRLLAVRKLLVHYRKRRDETFWVLV